MRKFILFPALLMSGASFAQITLNQNNMPSNPVGTDVLYNTVLNSAIPAAGPGTGITWDFGAASYQPTTYPATYATATGFAGATHSSPSFYFIDPSKKYETELMLNIGSDGIKLVGERLKRQAFSLNTGNPADSIVVLGQDVKYDQPQLQLKYPAAYNGTWTSTSKYATNLTITYMPLANNTPAQRRTEMTSTYNVIGWGDVKIMMLNNFVSAKVPVLEIQNIISFKDSFYINGAPAPAQVLTQLGMSQGQMSYAYVRSFHRAGFVTPVASIAYKDAQYSQLKDVNLHREKLPPFEASVKDLLNDDAVKVYPNPVTNGKLTIEMNTSSASRSYALTNISGQVLATGNIVFNNNKAEIVIPADIAAGNYFLVLSSDEGVVACKQVSLNR